MPKATYKGRHTAIYVPALGIEADNGVAVDVTDEQAAVLYPIQEHDGDGQLMNSWDLEGYTPPAASDYDASGDAPEGGATSSDVDPSGASGDPGGNADANTEAGN